MKPTVFLVVFTIALSFASSGYADHCKGKHKNDPGCSGPIDEIRMQLDELTTRLEALEEIVDVIPLVFDSSGLLFGQLVEGNGGHAILLRDLTSQGRQFFVQFNVNNNIGYIETQLQFLETDCQGTPYGFVAPVQPILDALPAHVNGGVAYVPEDINAEPTGIIRKSELQPNGDCENLETGSQTIGALMPLLDLDVIFTRPFSLTLLP